MKKPNSLLLGAITTLSVALAGCGDQAIDTVKSATVPQDASHTYETALANRDSCEKVEWTTFKDETNRTGVEYRCTLKDGSALLAATRTKMINETRREFQNYYLAMDQRVEEARQRPASLERMAAERQEQLAQVKAREAQANQNIRDEDPVQALRRATVTGEMGAVASTRFMAERAQQSSDDARNSLDKDLASLQREKERFQQGEQNKLAQIEKEYGGISQATQVFQWFVKDETVFPTWAGIELAKSDGSTSRLDKNWDAMMRNLLRSRGNEYVRYALGIPGDVVPGQQQVQETDAAKMAPSADQPSSSQGQACYDAKLKDFRAGMGEEAPISHDMLNEWRSECGLPALD